MATDLQNMVAIRSNYLASLAAEAALQAAGNPRPDYSLDGESVSWDRWREAMQARIDKYTTMIALEQSPYVVVSRMRP